MRANDPFTRGPHPVGVRTEIWQDPARDIDITVEVWYPADDSHRGQDLDPATWDLFVPDWAAALDPDEVEPVAQQAVRNAEWHRPPEPPPLVLLIHGWAGFRRESTFLGTHLASHGYVVVSPDVHGSTWNEVDAFLTAQEPEGPPAAMLEHARGIAITREKDIPFLVSTAIERLPVRPDGVGVTGASFGGFSSVIAPNLDARVAAIAPMCPANDDAAINEGSQLFQEWIDRPWKSDAAVLICAGDRDSLLPLYGQLALLRSLPASRKGLVALGRADHNHFVDDIDVGHEWMAEFVARVARLFPNGPGDWPRVARSIGPISRLVPGETAKTAWRGAITTHFDAHLRGSASAAAALTDLNGTLARAGVEATSVWENR